MKNMAFNQKLMLFMLITAFLMCWFQGVSHGGGVVSAIGDAVGAVGTGIGTGIGGVGTAVGATVGAVGTAVGAVVAGTVLIVTGVLDLSVHLIATGIWGAYSLSGMVVIPDGGLIGVVESNLIHLGTLHAVTPHTTLTYDSPINGIAFSPNSPLLASGSTDDTIQLWDLNTNTLQATLEGHTGDVLDVVFSPDGSLLASGGADGTLRLWDTHTGTLQATLEGHTGDVLDVVFSPDGSLLVSGGADGTLRLWDPVTETLTSTLEAHMDSVLSVAFSPDGLLLASGSADGLAGLWDTHTGTLQATLGHESPVLSLAFSPDSDLLATGSTDEVVRLWDPHIPEHKATLGHESPVESVAFNGNTLVTGSQDGRVRQWEITSETAPTAGSQRSESTCQVGDTLAPGESCTYPGTDATFSVLDNGNARWSIPNFPLSDKTSIGGSLSFTATINGKRYHFVATARAGNSWEIVEIGDRINTVDDGDDPPSDSESQPTGITASTTAPLTEATLNESVVTLTLNGGTFERSIFKIRDAVTVSGVAGVTVGIFDIDRVSDTKITVELTFDGTDFDTTSTLTFTVGAGAIANYSGSAFTAQVPVASGSESLVASSAAPLTEATLDGSVVTLTLTGRTFERSTFKIRDAVTVSGVVSVTVGTFDIDRVSDTKITVELTFGGNINTDSTLTFTVGAGAIANYSGSAFTAQVPVASGSESLVASSAAPLTEATLNESVVTLTLTGRTFESWTSRIRNAVTVSGISGVTVGTFDIDRVSDTEVTVELTFDGTNFDTGKQLTFTVEAGAIAGYDGPAITDQIPVTASTESMRVSTTTPLTESSLDGSVVTLTLSGRSYESSSYTVGRAITVSGIDGVTFRTSDVDRISDTQATVELSFSGNINTNTTLTFTVGANAIDNYSGAALTARIPVTSVRESLVASSAAPLIETTLNGSVVTLTLSGRSYESSSYTVGRAITVSGIDGVTFRTSDVDRISDTQATVELSFSGNITTDSTLTFTAGAGAIEGYDGPALTATISVAAGPAADANNDQVVDLQDLVFVASNYGQTGQNPADVNGDGVVDIKDLTVVASAIDNAAAAPLAQPDLLDMFNAAEVKLWLSHAQQLDLTDTTVRRGILFLEQLLAALTPKETILLPNYPNPFNPETWIPYHLASDADVLLSIYDINGMLVHELDLGYQQAGYYTDRSRAAYWDGRNGLGERVASGIYFYQLRADGYSAPDEASGLGRMRKMVILK